MCLRYAGRRGLELHVLETLDDVVDRLDHAGIGLGIALLFELPDHLVTDRCGNDPLAAVDGDLDSRTLVRLDDAGLEADTEREHGDEQTAEEAAAGRGLGENGAETDLHHDLLETYRANRRVAALE